MRVYLRNTYISAVFYVIILSGCITAPDATNDPKTSGLFGGLKGIIRGDYEYRVKKDEEYLYILTRQQEELKSETASLEKARQLTREDIARQQRELDDLNKEIKRLSGRINNLVNVTKSNEIKTRELRQKCARLEEDIRETKNDIETARLTYEQLEDRRDALKRVNTDGLLSY